MDDAQFLVALRRCLRSEVGDEVYASWFDQTTRLEVDGATLRVAAPNRFAADLLSRNYRSALERAAQGAGRELRVEWLVDATLEERPAEAELPGATAPAEKPTTAAPRRVDHALERWVAGEANRLALTAAHMVVDRPGSVSPLVVYGPTAVGKTHLLRGVVSGALQRGAVRRAVYVTAEQFTTAFVEALSGGGLPNFRQKFRDVELLAIDDAQFFLGKRQTLVELLHTIAALERTGGQLVLAADRPPSELADLGPELSTRLQGGMVCRVAPPDLATRREIAARWALEREVALEPSAAEFLAERFPRHVRQLIGAVHRLQAAGRERAAPWTAACAQRELADLLESDERSVRLADIERAVCSTFALDRQALQRGEKHATINAARQLAMWLARRHTRAGLAEIGRYFGGRTHSTVASAQKRVDELRQQRSAVHINGRKWTVDDALEQVAERLRSVG